MLLENSLEYIKQNHYKKSENLLNQLIFLTNQKSYVPYYNLGVIKESQGEYFKAKDYYIKADSLTIKPVDVISSAYLRIDSIIYKCQKTKEQISR